MSRQIFILLSPHSHWLVNLITRATFKEGKIELKVIDEGQGLKEADTNKIFKRFYSNRPDTFGKHSGLGLNIVKNLVDLHNGQIYASNNKDKGAKIEITFPKI